LAFGLVPRFQCLSCRKTFSSQTFSIDYRAKKKIDYRRLLVANASSESGRAIARSMDPSWGTVFYLIDRLSRQAAALAVITDEKKAYERIFLAHPLFRERDEEHRAVHVRLSSRLPLTIARRPASRATPRTGWRGSCVFSSSTIAKRAYS
jgi:hypothetical protein